MTREGNGLSLLAARGTQRENGFPDRRTNKPPRRDAVGQSGPTQLYGLLIAGQGSSDRKDKEEWGGEGR